MSRRRAAVLVGVHVVMAAHITHWVVTGSSISPVEPSEAMELSKHSIVNAGAVFFAVAILATAVFGRFFCGWGCHLVALQDLSRSLLARLGIRPVPLESRLLRLVPLVAFVYMFLWPVVYRLWIRDRFGPIETSITTSSFWATFPGWSLALATFLACGFGTVYLLGAKGFCTYACPYGAAFGLVDKVAPVRIRVTDACAGCGHCTAVCSSNVRVHEEVRNFGMVVDPGCMKCLDCVSVCPQEALYVGWGKTAVGVARKPSESKARRKSRRRGLGWGEELGLAALFLLGFLAFRGLYGVVPFLFSLGIAACLSFLGLTATRLVYRPNLRLRQWKLKRGGRLLPGGWAFLVAMTALLALWAHSGWIRFHEALGQRLYTQTIQARAAAFLPEAEAKPVSATEMARVTRAIDHLRTARDHGLVAQPGLDLQLAWLHAAEGDGGALEARASTAARFRSQRIPALLLLAQHAKAANRVVDAAQAYERVLAFDPIVADAYSGLGILWAEAGDVERAEAVFAHGVEALPENAGLHFNLALIRAIRGDVSQAIAGFEHTLKLDPNNRPARENLGGVLASVGRYAESVVHLERAALEAPEDASTQLLLARALLAMGSLDAARQVLATAIKLDPSLQPEAERLYATATNANGERPASDPFTP